MAALTKYFCGECRVECVSASKLAVHMWTHTGDKPFVCAYSGCDRSFARKGDLNRHQQAHSNARSHQCEECEQIFLRKTHLLRHIQSVHRQERSFECSTCHLSFAQSGNLAAHKRTHDDALARHPCDLCGASYVRQRDVKRHKTNCHSPSEPLPASPT